MKNKRTLVMVTVVMVISMLLAANWPALAAWIPARGMTAKVALPVKFMGEEITVTPETFPGKEVELHGVAKNITPLSDNLTYGMLYEVWAFYDWWISTNSAALAIGQAAPAKKQQQIRISPKGEMTWMTGERRNLQVQKSELPDSFTTPVGKAIIILDPDGPGPMPAYQYEPGAIVNIVPQQEHHVKAILKINKDAGEGTIRILIDGLYGEPGPLDTADRPVPYYPERG